MSSGAPVDAVLCSIYKYSDYRIVEPWISSIKKTDFSGDVVIIAINIPDGMYEQIKNNGVKVYRCTDDRDIHPNVLRFEYISKYLKMQSYSKVIVTDARDVVFQANPFNYLRNIDKKYKIVASSENILIRNESWMKDNLISTFGTEAYERIKDTEALCAGVIAGDGSYVASLCDEIFSASLHASANTANTNEWNENTHWSTWSKDPADQAAYNVLLRSDDWLDLVKVSGLDEDWNVNMGVSTYNNADMLIHSRGSIHHNIVKNSKGQLFCIVHQYDRIDQLKYAVLETYLR